MEKIKRIFLPGIIFQSVLIGGGYASGVETVQYVSRFSDTWVFIILSIFILFFVLLYLCFEIGRLTSSTNYKSWASSTASFEGKSNTHFWNRYSWRLFDVVFNLLAIIVLAAVIDFSTQLLPYDWSGFNLITTLLVIAFSHFIIKKGESFIDGFKTIGTALLYLVYISIFVFFYQSIQLDFSSGMEFDVSAIKTGWTFVGYNMIAFPAALYAVVNLESRKEVLISSLIAALFVTVPLLFLNSLLIGDPSYITSTTPLKDYLVNNSAGWIIYFYFVAVGFTLLETCVGFIHAIFLRFVKLNTDKPGSNRASENKLLLNAYIIVLIAGFISFFGVISLVAKGYSTLSWVFLGLLFYSIINYSRKNWSELWRLNT